MMTKSAQLSPCSMNTAPRSAADQRGFTLVEIAIVLVIVGMLIAGFTGSLGTFATQDRQQGAQTYLERSRQALLDYVGVNGYLPCPDTDAVPDGRADAGAGRVCDDWTGTLPWLDLGMEAQTDWDAPVRYAVHQAVTSTARCSVLGRSEPVCFFDTPASFDLQTPVTGNALTIDNGTGAGADPIAQNLLAVLVAYGSNSLDTWANCAAGGRSAEEDENCDNDRVFVQTAYRAGPDDGFDDQLVWLDEFAVKAALTADTSANSALPVSLNPYIDLAENYDDATSDDQVDCSQVSGSCDAGTNGDDTTHGDTDSNAPDDTLGGGNGDDTLNGGEGDDRLYGGRGRDTLNGEAGNDLLNGGSGDDALNGGEGHDFLWGGTGSDTLQGEAGDDLLFGYTGNDVLQGGSGVDFLFGGENNDTLNGGSGRDWLSGGSGNDVLVYNDDPTAYDPTTTFHAGVDWMFGGEGNDALYIHLSLNNPVIAVNVAGTTTEIVTSERLPTAYTAARITVNGQLIAIIYDIETIYIGSPPS